MEYNVKIDGFEGPLDLLLHLIQSLELDIYDIPMAQITEQYLLYIHTLKELQLDVASEYLVMAATLLAIKSKMLLPKQEPELFDEPFEYEEDPRDDLVEKLIEYRKFKEAATNFKKLEEERALIFTKPPSDLSGYVEEGTTSQDTSNVSIYDMIGALNKLLRRKKIQRPLTTRVARQEISIEQRIDEILQLIVVGKRTTFTSLFPKREKPHIVVTFIAILELMKRNEIIVNQATNFDEIFVMKKGAS